MKKTDPQRPFGFGTYQLRLCGLLPLHIYGFRMLDQATSFNLYINGDKVAQNGRVGRGKQDYTPDWKPVTGVFLADRNGEAEFLVEVANFDYYRGGFWNAISIGSPAAIHNFEMSTIYQEMFLFSSLFVMGVFFIGMYCVHPEDKGMVYFALFCLCIGIRVLLTGDRIITDFLPILTWNLRLRAEYFFGYLLLPLLGLFVSHLFPSARVSSLRKFYLFFALLLASTTIFLPHYIYSALLPYYKGLALLFAVFFISTLIKMIEQRKTGGIPIFITFIALLVALIKETYFPNETNYISFAGFIFIVSFSLVTMKKYFWVLQSNKLLESKAGTDYLTGLFNRDFFLNYVENYFYSSSHPQKCAFLFLDLDSFKQINDTVGHEAGDAILVEVSKRLKALCRSSDIICRYGGDEFLVFLGDDEKKHAVTIANRIIQSVQRPIFFEQQELQVGVSVGISHCTEQKSLSNIIKQSDMAMYRSKDRGGNTFTFFEDQ